jgi:hypothetical protein
MKVFKNQSIKGYNGEVIKVRVNPETVEDLNLHKVFWSILNNSPIKSQNDSIQGMRLAQALDKAKDSDTIELEDGTHDWIKPIAEQQTPSLFRLNGHLIYELIKEGFEKPNEPVK